MPSALTRKQLNHELKTLGFGGLEDRNLMTQLALFYTTHDQFRGLLMSTHPEKRRACYDAIAPRLRFKAKPLEDYEVEMRQKAEKEQLPGFNYQTGEVIPYKVGEIDIEKPKGSLILDCVRCTATESFPSKNRAKAMNDAMEAGWTFERRESGEVALCKDCTTVYSIH